MHRLSLKVAAGAASAAAIIVTLLFVLYQVQLWLVLPAAVVVGTATYIICLRLVAQRLELGRATLKQIRQHKFENLEAAHLPRGDELNALIWQVYRTGLVLEKEIVELRKIENYRREYIGNVSHELKTPIFAIQGFAETLLEGALEDPRYNRSFVEKIMRNATRLSALAQDLSEIARIETGELQMTEEPFVVADVVHEVLDSLDFAARQKEVDLKEGVTAGTAAVLGDRERIRQVLINLIDNAIKYNNRGGHVTVEVKPEPNGAVRIAVVDNGIGVAPQDVPRLTERFYRVDKSRSRYQGGTGLGLAIVKHILAAHGTRLEVESTPNVGSSFAFVLPAAD